MFPIPKDTSLHPAAMLKELEFESVPLNPEALFTLKLYKVTDKGYERAKHHEDVGEIKFQLSGLEYVLTDLRRSGFADGTVEAALESRVQDVNLPGVLVDGKPVTELHIPQIDGAGPFGSMRVYHVNCQKDGDERTDVLEERGFSFFESGRSYHAQGRKLLTAAAWVQYMGDLLLMNSEEGGIVDTRWVGHCLTRGFSALRWTCNNTSYKMVPSRLVMS